MNRQIFVEKKSGFLSKATSVKKELIKRLGLKSLKDLRLIQVYDVFDLDESLYELAKLRVFSEPVTDNILSKDEIQTAFKEYEGFAIEALPGQFSQSASGARDALLLLGGGLNVQVKTAKLYLLNKDIAANELQAIKTYLLNPIESRFKDFSQGLVLDEFKNASEKNELLSFFFDYGADEFALYKQKEGLALEVADLLFIRDYFKGLGRYPSYTELKVLDTYWSDHCRHTTFETLLEKFDFSASEFKEQLENSYELYLKMRQELKSTKPQTLMDMATIFGRYERANGRLDDLEISDEINACSIEIEVDVDGKKEPWLLMFKNETHNHPTEIEPFGGAATCIGGAIRDPLSGRSYVYGAMRISGAGDITAPLQNTRKGKLAQAVISKTAAQGYSSYGNQIGLATTYVKEYFHPGFVAKRLELGAVLGAAPKAWVRREKPAPGDLILILGGRTGRDGIGGASGSSKAQTKSSLYDSGAQVQKGNAIEERKIQRLFRNPEVTRLIKKSNDFGAGGVCVAIGELADGVEIELDKIPLKHQGLNATEIAISESQERMAVLISPADKELFIAKANAENVEAVVVARVSKTPSLVMRYKGQKIADLPREFLNTNGVRAKSDVRAVNSGVLMPYAKKTSSYKKDLLALLSSLNHASQKGLVSLFDSSVGRLSVNAPLGGAYQLSPAESCVLKLPVPNGANTKSVSVMAAGYEPYVACWSPYHGAIYAIIEASARLVATGSEWQKARFSFQEYFRSMRAKPENFGEPVSALLGALQAQYELGLPAVGGKDSMSGSFEELSVPPTLVAFGVTTSSVERILSPEFKRANEWIYYLPAPLIQKDIDFKAIKQNFKTMSSLQEKYNITACISIKYGGLLESLALMMFGNKIGALIDLADTSHSLSAQLGGFVFTSADEIKELKPLGRTSDKFELCINGDAINGDELLNAFTSPLQSIYPSSFEQNAPLSQIKSVKKDVPSFYGKRVDTPLVYIPVFPGTNSEYESAKAFMQAGAKVRMLPFRNLNEEMILNSIDEMVQEIKKAHIIFLAGGFSAADEPDGSAKFIVNVLRNAKVQGAIESFLQKGGLMIGICNGFQALIKSGLLPYGDFKSHNINSPTLFYNDSNQHIAKMVQTRITNTNSPWLKNVKVGDIHTIAVSHGEGKFVVSADEFARLCENGQIFSQYVDMSGKASMDSEYNPNGSYYAIEGLTSPNGQIIGKMGHSERYEKGLFKNIPGVKDQGLFESAVEYFRGVKDEI